MIVQRGRSFWTCVVRTNAGVVSLQGTVSSEEEAMKAIREALDTPGVVIVDIPVDYSKNVEIGEHVLPDAWD